MAVSSPSPNTPHSGGSDGHITRWSSCQTAHVTRVAVLDDYHRRAHGYADWASLGDDVEVEFFSEPIAQDEIPGRLRGFDVLVLMRERTRLGSDVLSQLPDLRLVVTTGMRNASLAVDHLLQRGVTVSVTQGTGAAPSAGVPST